jgi:hypothetical protein
LLSARLQAYPMTRSHTLSSAHVVAHAPPAHRKLGWHAVAAGGVQVPVPVHMPAPPVLDRPSVEQPTAVVQASPACVWQALPFIAHSALVPQV